MKKIFPLLLSSVLGGLVAISVYNYFGEEKGVIIRERTDSTAIPAAYFSSAAERGAITNENFVSAAEYSLNAVVHVRTEYAPQTVAIDPFFEWFFGGQPIQQKPSEGSGSGVIISNDGYIVTNNHVIDGADKIEVSLNSKKNYKAKLIGKDPSSDLALLKIEGADFPFIPYGNSDEVRVGEWVLAVGNPFNLRSTVTAGIISAKGRNINILGTDEATGNSAVESFLQTDAAVNKGNSGGALVNLSGELIGINAAIKSNTGSYTGYSFAIPVNIVRKVVDDLLNFGMVQRAFIGVSIQNITDELAQKEKLSDLNGIYVSGITKDGAADEAGIKTGDVITRVGAIKVSNIPELQEQLSKFRPGDNVLLTVKRKNQEREFNITLKNKFGNTEIIKKEIPSTALALGASFENAGADEMKKLKITQGVKVVKLDNGKLKQAGLREGFIITAIDNKPISKVSDVEAAIEGKKGGVLIEGVYPNGMRAYYGLGI
jgi:serine protease Do